DQAVGPLRFEQHRCPLVSELEDRRRLGRRPAAQPAADRIGAHSDLLERGLDLVEWQGAVVGQGKPRAKENRRRWAVRLPRAVGQAVEDGIELTRPFRIKPMHEAHCPSSPSQLPRSPPAGGGGGGGGAASTGGGISAAGAIGGGAAAGPIAGSGMLFSCRSA